MPHIGPGIWLFGVSEGIGTLDRKAKSAHARVRYGCLRPADEGRFGYFYGW